MKRWIWIVLACTLCVQLAARPGESTPSRWIHHLEACDASAAAVLGGGLFAAASDEDNVLRIYRLGTSGIPVARLKLDRALGREAKEAEADLEGAARMGDRVYWIGSHGRSKEGKLRPGRRLFLATEVIDQATGPRLKPIGRAYTRLVEDLVEAPTLGGYRLGDAALCAPDAPGGLNIEGLVAWPEGRLSLGFRNPTPDGKALLVPLENPAEVAESGRRARFGSPWLLDLHGLGIRDLVWTGERMYVVAGRTDGGGKSRLYVWRGQGDAPRRVNDLKLGDFNAEAVVWVPDPRPGALWLLSDDGRRETGGVPCRDLADPSARSFRALPLRPEVLSDSVRADP